MRELALELRPSVATPISREVSPRALRASLQALGARTIQLSGADRLGMPASLVYLCVEPDAEFLVVFAKALEAAAESGSKRTVTVFLSDGLLELSAAFLDDGAWCRMGYLDEVGTVEMPAGELLSYWRTFVDDLAEFTSRPVDRST